MKIIDKEIFLNRFDFDDLLEDEKLKKRVIYFCEHNIVTKKQIGIYIKHERFGETMMLVNFYKLSSMELMFEERRKQAYKDLDIGKANCKVTIKSMNFIEKVCKKAREVYHV